MDILVKYIRCRLNTNRNDLDILIRLFEFGYFIYYFPYSDKWYVRIDSIKIVLLPYAAQDHRVQISSDLEDWILFTN